MTEENKVTAKLNITAQEQTAITATFEQHMLECPDTGAEYWSARTLMVLLGYASWRKFYIAIQRAMETCQGTGGIASDQFVPRDKLVEHGSGAKREIKDFHLSRFACYLIAMNGNTRKPVIRLAQRFFALKTWEMQKIDAARTDQDRDMIRSLIMVSEVELAGVIEALGGNSHEQAVIRSQGDLALFKRNTADMKALWLVKSGLALADVMVVELLNAKLHINNLTVANSSKCTTINDLRRLHIANSDRKRAELIARNLTPEQMEPMLPVGSVTGDLGIKVNTAMGVVGAYASFLTDDNISGYSGIQYTDGAYIGIINDSIKTPPMPNKQLALAALADLSVKADTFYRGSLLTPYHTYVIPAISVDQVIEVGSELEYLVAGYFTRILNGLDTVYVGGLLVAQGIDIVRIKTQFQLETKEINHTGYYVVDNCFKYGIFISAYK